MGVAPEIPDLALRRCQLVSIYQGAMLGTMFEPHVQYLKAKET